MQRNYRTQLKDIQNVTVANRWSPRQSGETAARSAWQEVSLPSGINEFPQRVALVKSLASQYSEVYLRTATVGGRARLFVKA